MRALQQRMAENSTAPSWTALLAASLPSLTQAAPSESMLAESEDKSTRGNESCIEDAAVEVSAEGAQSCPEADASKKQKMPVARSDIESSAIKTIAVIAPRGGMLTEGMEIASVPPLPVQPSTNTSPVTDTSKEANAEESAITTSHSAGASTNHATLSTDATNAPATNAKTRPNTSSEEQMIKSQWKDEVAVPKIIVRKVGPKIVLETESGEPLLREEPSEVSESYLGHLFRALNEEEDFTTIEKVTAFITLTTSILYFTSGFGKHYLAPACRYVCNRLTLLSSACSRVRCNDLVAATKRQKSKEAIANRGHSTSRLIISLLTLMPPS